MKKLSKFLKFDCQAFLNGKVLMVVGTAPWTDFDTKKVCGTTVEAVICKDETDYELNPGEQVSNLYEKVKIKVGKNDLKIPIRARIELVNPVGTVYGDFRNQLSLRCDDVRIIQMPKE